jgi:hypothetical protein
MLAWVENAPRLESNSETEVQKFIDKHISCSLPPEDENLHTLVTTLQRHTHSAACRKHGESCRFQFPKAPVNETIVCNPPDEQPSPAIQELYSNTLQSVHEQLLKMNPGDASSLTEILDRASVPESLYLRALRWIKTKKWTACNLLRRSPNEVNINNYNESLLLS